MKIVFLKLPKIVCIFLGVVLSLARFVLHDIAWMLQSDDAAKEAIFGVDFIEERRIFSCTETETAVYGNAKGDLFRQGLQDEWQCGFFKRWPVIIIVIHFLAGRGCFCKA